MHTKSKKKIKITEEDLKFIYSKDYKLFQDKILPNCFCVSCVKNGKHAVRIVNYEIFINDLSDIELQGFCANCGGRVGRYLETGEVEKYIPRIKKKIGKQGQRKKRSGTFFKKSKIDYK